MTCVASRVCLKAGWNGLAGPGALMARRTPLRRAALAVVMGSVVELHIEALGEFGRKCFDRRRV